MNLEIEYKYKISDLVPFREKLTNLGAEKEQTVHCTDTYFVVPNNPEGRKYLRIRDMGAKKELSYSVAMSELRTNEWETEVADASVTADLLKQLGYKIDVIVEKKRDVYIYKGSEVLLDTVVNLGKFVEIEARNEQTLLQIENDLGLEPTDRVKRMGYPDLVRGHLISN